MNTEEKIEFDVIFALQETTWKGIYFRHGVEWKLTIALWTVLSTFIGTVITGRISFLNLQNIIIFSIIGISIISALFILYLIGVWKFRQAQLSLIADYDKRLYKLTNTKRSELTNTRLSKSNKYNKISWSLVLKIGITLILLVGSIFAVFFAGGNKC